MTKRIVLGISGKAQSGKDTLAEYICEHMGGGYECVVLHMADELKRVCQSLFGLSDYQLYDPEGKKTETHILWENLPWYSGDKTGPLTGREFMEQLGTSCFRKVYADCHANSAVESIRRHEGDPSKTTLFFVPDVRAPNEIAKLHTIGAFVCRLKRNVENRQTDIECALDDYPESDYDFVIDNTNMSLEEKSRVGLEMFQDLLRNYKSCQ